ncbi:MAG: hypothetical protein ABSH48_14255 [Verrucomicrobiota bacterium]|jgi:hypothetical protein
MNRTAAPSGPLATLAIVVALGAATHAAMPYLPLIGPPALRLQKVNSPAAGVVQFQASPVSPLSATNPLTAMASQGLLQTGAATNDAAALAAIQSPPGEGTEGSLSDTFAAPILEMPTPDLLGISPQMLATYFLPVSHGTNSAALTGTFPLSFMPPLPPDKSSKAEYIVK